MNILIEDLDEETVEKLKQQAAEKQRSLQAHLKIIIQDAVEERERWRVWRERTHHIADIIRQSDWQRTFAAADRIREDLRASGRKFSDTTELLREDRER